MIYYRQNHLGASFPTPLCRLRPDCLLFSGCPRSFTIHSVRKENYVAVQTYIHDQAVYIPVYYGSRDGAQLAETEGIIWANDGYPEFTYVRVPA